MAEQDAPQTFSKMYDWLWERTELSLGAKALWCVIKRLQGNNAIAYARYETLSSMLGISRRQIMRYVDELERKRYLEIIVHFPAKDTRGDWIKDSFRCNDFITHDPDSEGAYARFSSREQQKAAHAVVLALRKKAS